MNKLTSWQHYFEKFLFFSSKSNVFHLNRNDRSFRCEWLIDELMTPILSTSSWTYLTFSSESMMVCSVDAISGMWNFSLTRKMSESLTSLRTSAFSGSRGVVSERSHLSTSSRLWPTSTMFWVTVVSSQATINNVEYLEASRLVDTLPSSSGMRLLAMKGLLAKKF